MEEEQAGVGQEVAITTTTMERPGRQLAARPPNSHREGYGCCKHHGVSSFNTNSLTTRPATSDEPASSSLPGPPLQSAIFVAVPQRNKSVLPKEKFRPSRGHASLLPLRPLVLFQVLALLLLWSCNSDVLFVQAHKNHVMPALVPPHAEDAHRQTTKDNNTNNGSSTNNINNSNSNSKKMVRLVLMPKSIDNPFFDPSGDGCMDRAAQLTAGGYNVTCTYTGPPADADDNSGELQAQMIRQLIANQSMDALAIAVRSVEVVGPAIQEAVQAGIPVVTFDSDAPDSGRLCYVGTDNYFFGTQIGKLLKQLKPRGGTFALLYSAESLNLQQRAQGFMDELEREPGVWTHLATADVQSNITKAMEDMHALANMDPPPDAIAPVMGMPMRSGTWKEFVDQHVAQKNITLVSGDAMANQIQFLERGYVHGLVGQLPYDFGAIAAQTLYNVLVQQQAPPSDIIGTNVITLVQVPLVLPPLEVDHNIIDQFHWVGFILFGIIVLLALGFAIWTFLQRNIQAVRVAQPMFLIMISCGTIVLASSLIPLSFDDQGYPDTLSDSEGVAICMSIPWLASSGFTITFSALFAKSWRVNRIFHNSRQSFSRITVTVQDVLVPFFVLLSLNTLILSLWTALDPLTYVRQDLPGTDGWNRVIATYGSCQSDNGVAFLVPLAVVNLSVLVLANWQAYQARMIQSEFSESKYIGIAMASLLQAMVSGIPILFVVRESPQAYYLVLSFMIFIICAVVLLVIFVPKMVMVEKFANESPAQQKKRIMSSIRQSRASITRKYQQNGSSDGANGSRVSFFASDSYDSSRFLIQVEGDDETAPQAKQGEQSACNDIREKEKPISIFDDFKSETESLHFTNSNAEGSQEQRTSSVQLEEAKEEEVEVEKAAVGSESERAVVFVESAVGNSVDGDSSDESVIRFKRE